MNETLKLRNKLRDEELENITKACDECYDKAEYHIINGDDTCIVCETCASKIVFDMVTSNDHVSFTTRKEEGLLVIE